ncbi:hypothetical protein [Streptomyces sp. NPDC096013]|uniref:hypothetical protein n=1 Tax=Streptomyces sp. NPDC096013 TaxID=3366069 RepID=UPI0037F4B72D
MSASLTDWTRLSWVRMTGAEIPTTMAAYAPLICPVEQHGRAGTHAAVDHRGNGIADRVEVLLELRRLTHLAGR